MPDLGRDHGERVAAEGLPRLEEIPLPDLVGSRDSALALAIARLLDAGERGENYAAFGNAA